MVRQRTGTPTKIRKFLTSPAAKVRRKLDNGVRRPREADRFLKLLNSLYSYRPKDQPRAPGRRVPVKNITLYTTTVHQSDDGIVRVLRNDTKLSTGCSPTSP
ncbi:hypothetical protein AB5J52_46855 [Streptomyces sp. R39]|uniref:mRNA interferase YoeB n=1 Tax=Streptomyces sp. R39 TaxID=3238631 RepID=A0AB39R1V4_9ACTN